MPLNDLLGPESVYPALKATSKKQALQILAEKAALQTGLDERDIFRTLIAREKLGSTGVGHGVAIPHGKLASLDRIHGFLARASTPIEFEAVDEQPVDLIFLLLAPEDAGAEHLKVLAKVARIMREPDRLARIRAAAGTKGILGALVVDGTKSDAA